MVRAFIVGVMMNRLVCLLILLVCAAGISAQTNNETVDANRQRAEMLWDEAIRAKGGRERLHSIDSFLISSTIDAFRPSGHTDTTTERLYVMPGKAWLYEFTPDFDVSLEGTVMNNDMGLCLVTLAPVGPMHSVPGLTPCLPTRWSERLIQDPVIYLMETKWVRPVPVRTHIEGKGKKQLDVIETMVGNMPVHFYLDRKTHLPAKLVTDYFEGDPRLTGHLKLEVTFEKYVDVDGVQMPRRVIRDPLVAPQIISYDTEIARYSFNVIYDDKIFYRPVSRKAKRDDWKPRK